MFLAENPTISKTSEVSIYMLMNLACKKSTLVELYTTENIKIQPPFIQPLARHRQAVFLLSLED